MLARLHHLWADQGYTGKLLEWIAERSLAWIGHYRRMSKGDERLPSTSEVLVLPERAKREISIVTCDFSTVTCEKVWGSITLVARGGPAHCLV